MIDATIQLFIRVSIKPFIVLQEFFLTVQLKQLPPLSASLSVSCPYVSIKSAKYIVSDKADNGYKRDKTWKIQLKLNF
jgi:hypothetical protein